MARASLANVITFVRNLTGEGTADRSDDNIQALLDSYRRDVVREPLRVELIQSGGSALYHDYYYTGKFAETVDGGTTIWRLENSAGSVMGTADYTVNYDARHVRFTSDQRGTALYLTYRNHNPYRAAADIFRQKAGIAAQYFNVSTDNHSLQRGGQSAKYLALADQMERYAIMQDGGGARSFTLSRSDVN